MTLPLLLLSGPVIALSALWDYARRKRHPRKEPAPVAVCFPLAKSFLCCDCNTVGDSSAQCPACASRSLISLANVLDRAEVPDAPNERVDKVLARMEAWW
jgi:hypothetical protein